MSVSKNGLGRLFLLHIPDAAAAAHRDGAPVESIARPIEVARLLKNCGNAGRAAGI